MVNASHISGQITTAKAGQGQQGHGRAEKYSTAPPSYKYDYHLDTELGFPHEYRDLTNILANATENDEVHLYINGPGGYVTTCLQIVNLIQNCRATVVGHLLGFCRSAHSFIFLACHEFVVYHNSEIMAHCYSGGSWGKGQEIVQHATATREIFERLVTDVYYPFYTEEEVASIMDNRDIYINGSENLMPRINRLVDYRVKLLEQREAMAIKEARRELDEAAGE